MEVWRCMQDAEALVMYAGAAGLTCLAEVPLPRLPATGDILGEGGANSSPGALAELMGEPAEPDDSTAATQPTTSATPADSPPEPLSRRGSPTVTAFAAAAALHSSDVA